MKPIDEFQLNSNSRGKNIKNFKDQESRSESGRIKRKYE